ncbi:LysR family transcriptional regulator [Enterococcus dongliensis]|uniref:LysR family transcriptional regulator n=1 Tax=Enterococcus dongliensis TaxID=2559925 RepID=UPI00288D26E2|nr:LysR family transcriptional regulator [Enterococcus dongliensis]MDT2674332.1 LysR family transcriptional regulator [Enterococcus dongliensis]
MNLRQLEFFVILAQTEHMTQAAKKTNTSQPNISHAMTMLEQEIGVTLFEKKGRNIQLTRHGRIFYEYVAPALARIEKGQKKLQEMIDPNSGEIQFGFIFTMGAKLAPRLAQSFHQQGNDKVSFEFQQGNSNQIIKMLLEDHIDIGICSKVSDDPELIYQILTQEEMVVVVPLNHPLARYDAISLAETTEYPYVYYNKQSGLRPYLDQQTRKLKLDLKIVCELEEDHSILGFVGEGYGIAIMPNVMSITSFPVKKITIKDRVDDRNIYLAVKRNNLEIPVLKKFYDFCLENLNKKWD